MKKKVVTMGSLLVALGIVYGDIGTSPLYVMQAILSTNNNYSSRGLILGGVSLVFWTLTLQTTIKYIIFTLRADNNGEGGIFALYTLVKKYAKWLIVPAIIGGGALLADGILTPPVSVSSAIEGLNVIFPIKEEVTIIIVIVIILGLFLAQRFGTEKIGRIFGPIMLIWFLMIGILGFSQITKNPGILQAVNPYYALKLIMHGNSAVYILGAVFLCTTGAEALYSDLGHCGRSNIYYTWVLVKICLLLSYFGQGAYLLARTGQQFTESPFFLVMPKWFIIPGVIIATLATIIASQALISGSFTLVSEAIKLNIFPRLHIRYPNGEKGQLYIGAVNTALCIGCIGIVLIFKKSENMEAAYGLAITITMLMTTILLSQYIRYKKKKKVLWVFILVIFGTIETSFLYANSFKILSGGYITLLITAGLIFLMYIWSYSSQIKKKYRRFVNLFDYKEKFKLIQADKELPLYANNIVYLTKSKRWNEVENKIVYSIFNKDPKKAENYWFINITVTDEPYTKEYKFNTIQENRVFSIEFKLGFRLSQGVNTLLAEVVQQLMESGEVQFTPKEYMITSGNRKAIGNFKFILLEEVLHSESTFSGWDKFILSAKLLIKKLTVSPQKWYGMDTSVVEVEKVPILFGQNRSAGTLKRIYDK
ncbi:KUP/HAK/KT family potassium transporter [uncultured Clostridium sp.]|uniref:KUP/HAK/KT family potassium transporter n=1 Tax=uncultured Clostridium sp. TaxID=59620 RepID=UPI00260DD46E|nr:KUP/HAK/KT family potassium transporter [uncultured Clostridium sp.]